MSVQYFTIAGYGFMLTKQELDDFVHVNAPQNIIDEFDEDLYDALNSLEDQFEVNFTTYDRSGNTKYLIGNFVSVEPKYMGAELYSLTVDQSNFPAKKINYLAGLNGKRAEYLLALDVC